jgi:dynein heavy chain
MTAMVRFLSLGQGQGDAARKVLKEGQDGGYWVVLQNCHLSPSFMPEVERMLLNLGAGSVHSNYRLWLTTSSSPGFPASIYLRGVKVTFEPPSGLRNNMARAVGAVGKWYDEAAPALQRMVVALCYFHSLCLERRQFGAIGWNIPYDFTAPDLAISLGVLRQTSEQPDWKAIHYMIAEANYGGKVTDFLDRALINTLIRQCLNPATFA